MIVAYNLADMTYPRSDPRMDPFFDNVDKMNALAERSPGFVWRLKSFADDGHRAAQVAGTTLTTMSVWESPEALGDYVFNTVHVQFYLKRHEWFDAITRSHFVMWNHTADNWPDEDEAIARLAHFQTHGSTDYAFGWDVVDTSRWPRMGQTKAPAVEELRA